MTATSYVGSGSYWAYRHGKFIAVSFYISVVGTLNTWTVYRLFNLGKIATFDVKAVGVSQSDGKGHILEAYNGLAVINLAIKGEGFTSGDWLWGCMYLPTNVK